MAGYLKAALCAATFLCASQAQAADFIRYDIVSEGTGNYARYAGQDIVSSPYARIAFSYVVALSPGIWSIYQEATSITFAASSTGVGGGAGGTSLRIGGTNFTVSDRTFNQFTIDSGRLNISTCLSESAGNAFPLGRLAVGGCGSVSYYQQLGSRANTQFEGVVTSITGTAFTADTSRVGIIASFVPEPATWALMLVGFGMTGYALRRRRARVVFA